MIGGFRRRSFAGSVSALAVLWTFSENYRHRDPLPCRMHRQSCRIRPHQAQAVLSRLGLPLLLQVVAKGRQDEAQRPVAGVEGGGLLEEKSSSSPAPYMVPIASVTWWLGSEMDNWLAWPRRLEKLPPTSRGRDEVCRERKRRLAAGGPQGIHYFTLMEIIIPVARYNTAGSGRLRCKTDQEPGPG